MGVPTGKEKVLNRMDAFRGLARDDVLTWTPLETSRSRRCHFRRIRLA